MHSRLLVRTPCNSWRRKEPHMCDSSSSSNSSSRCGDVRVPRMLQAHIITWYIGALHSTLRACSCSFAPAGSSQQQQSSFLCADITAELHMKHHNRAHSLHTDTSLSHITHHRAAALPVPDNIVPLLRPVCVPPTCVHAALGVATLCHRVAHRCSVCDWCPNDLLPRIQTLTKQKLMPAPRYQKAWQGRALALDHHGRYPYIRQRPLAGAHWHVFARGAKAGTRACLLCLLLLDMGLPGCAS